MAITEAARADLYNGLAEVLGPDRAETLMTQLPDYDPIDIATKDDIGVLKSDISGLKSDISGLGTRLDTLGNRLDRLFLTLVAGLFAIIAAMAGVVFVAL